MQPSVVIPLEATNNIVPNHSLLNVHLYGGVECVQGPVQHEWELRVSPKDPAHHVNDLTGTSRNRGEANIIDLRGGLPLWRGIGW